jgi:hypothetical protein
MTPPDRAGRLRDAPLNELIAVLLRQYRRLLAARGIELTEAQIQALAQRAADAQPPDALAQSISAALADLVAESLALLAGWGLSFDQALRTPMTDMPGWETTAEFLEIANDKANAELRVASGAALAAALGDLRHADHLLAAIEHAPDELESVAGRRILLRASGVDPAAPDWLAQARAWVESGPR